MIEPGDRILLVRLSAIGDALRLLPAVRFLRSNAFDGVVDCVVEPPTHQVLETVPEIDNTYELPLKNFPDSTKEIWSIINELRANNYDWVFDLHGLLKSGALTFLTRAANRIGYSKQKSREFNYYFQTSVLNKPLPQKLPRILKYVQLVRSVSPPDYEFTLDAIRPVMPDFEPRTDGLLREAKDQPIIIHPMSSHSRYGHQKEWGTDNFTRMIQQLLNWTDHPVKISWGPGERQSAEKLAKSVRTDRVTITAETKRLTDLAYQLQNASLLVTVDTSVAHLADFLNIPEVVVFGGSSFRKNAPLFAPNRFVTRHSTEGRIEDIPVSRVLGAIKDLCKSTNRLDT